MLFKKALWHFLFLCDANINYVRIPISVSCWGRGGVLLNKYLIFFIKALFLTSKNLKITLSIHPL